MVVEPRQSARAHGILVVAISAVDYYLEMGSLPLPGSPHPVHFPAPYQPMDDFSSNLPLTSHTDGALSVVVSAIQMQQIHVDVKPLDGALRATASVHAAYERSDSLSMREKASVIEEAETVVSAFSGSPMA